MRQGCYGQSTACIYLPFPILHISATGHVSPLSPSGQLLAHGVLQRHCSPKEMAENGHSISSTITFCPSCCSPPCPPLKPPAPDWMMSTAFGTRESYSEHLLTPFSTKIGPNIKTCPTFSHLSQNRAGLLR